MHCRPVAPPASPRLLEERNPPVDTLSGASQRFLLAFLLALPSDAHPVPHFYNIEHECALSASKTTG
jgi:hypothetical protein